MCQIEDSADDSKRTIEFVREIQGMIHNDPSELIKSIASNIGMSEFLMKQVVHEDIQYFSNKMRKSYFLSLAMKGKMSDRAVILLNKLKNSLRPNRLWFTQENLCKH